MLHDSGTIVFHVTKNGGTSWQFCQRTQTVDALARYKEINSVREVFAIIADWLEHDVPFALGTLVQTFNSSPAPIGTTIAVDLDSRIVGNIGAGCYESDIVQACLQTVSDGHFRLLPINLSRTDEITGSTGCGGAINIAIWKPQPGFYQEATAIARGLRDVSVTLPEGFSFTLGAKKRLVLVGATTLAQELARMARSLDFFVTVADPRPLFATPQRIPDADELVLEWPDEYLPRVLSDIAALVVISHDPKFDIAALAGALRSDVPYIGLLGSRRSQAARREALREAGFGEPDLSRIHGPVGLDLGGRSTAETALSILAQIVALRNSRTGAPLEALTSPIHDPPTVTA